MAYFYVPNGINMAHWRPSEEGPLQELQAILKPLESLKDRVVVISDLAADHCDGKGRLTNPLVVVSLSAKSANTPKSLKWGMHRLTKLLPARLESRHGRIARLRN